MPQISKTAKQVNQASRNDCLKSPKLQNKSITRQEMVASNLQNRKTSQSSANKWLPQISKIAEQVNHPAGNGCPKSPKSQNKSIKWQEMVASNLQNCRTSQSPGKKWLPQISKTAKQVNQASRNDCLKSPKSQNKSIKRQQMVAPNLQNRKTSQSPGKKWLPQISKIAKQVNHPAGNGCLKSPKTQNKSNILSHIG
ncbi:hypothetical protein DXA57_01890 [Blautia sp. OF03-15BH]|nr:hypothetical protein DXA57_01890 [Blautia sp. OF03-15BH]